LLGFIADPDYGDLSDPLNGRDIVLDKLSPAEAGNQYGKTTIRVKPSQTPLTEDKTQFTNLLEKQVELTEIYSEPTYDELKEALTAYLSPDDEPTNTDTTTTTNGVTATTTPTTNVGATTEETPAAPVAANVEDAFDKLFNEDE